MKHQTDKETHLSVSIVIPAWNESDIIIPCLKASLNQTIEPKEVIIVDNKSTDDTVAKVQEFVNLNPNYKKIVKIVHQDKIQGLIPTRNKGLDMAKGDIIGRIDADAIIRPDWVEVVSKVFGKNKKVMAATGPCTYYDMPSKRVSLSFDRNLRKLIMSHKSEKTGIQTLLFGTNMAIRNKAWKAIGKECCLDKEDKLHEDMDITIHFAKHGYEVAFVSDMVAGMSARRISNSLKDFNEYQNRAINTYKAHGLSTGTPQLVKSTFMTIYFPLHALYPIYQRRFVKNKELIENELWKDRGMMEPVHKKIARYLSPHYIRNRWKGL
ncbi:MAG: glycosyltransferase [Candidatus Ancillula sp.]|jgi:glycosyltransferase involved in cell wall biosynthesis|nr:glycosyltransferase [Candidatus Ancillula sp.]